MNKVIDHNIQTLELKRQNSNLGKSSVAYDLINFNSQNNERGKQLEQDDLNSKV
jgi:hypothetical protein